MRFSAILLMSCGAVLASSGPPLPPGYYPGSPTPASGATLLKSTTATASSTAPDPNFVAIIPKPLLNLTITNGLATVWYQTNVVDTSKYKLMRSADLQTWTRTYGGKYVGSNIVFQEPATNGVCYYKLSTNWIQQIVTLSWDNSADTNVSGYYAYYGSGSRLYTNRLDSGLANSIHIGGLVEGVTYYFAVTAHNKVGEESVYSSEVSYSVPKSIAVIDTRRKRNENRS